MENKDYKKIYEAVVECIGGLLLVWIAQWLWNELCTDLFSAPFITYWQMLGLKILANILLHQSTLSAQKKS